MYDIQYECKFADCEGNHDGERFSIEVIAKHFSQLRIPCPLCGRVMDFHFRGRAKRKAY